MSRVIHYELILPITAKFICVCTMYVQCMYNVYHGSWRDFTTAVGVIVCTEMNMIFGATFVGRWFVEVLSANCSRENVGGEMFAGKRSVRFAHTAHASLMGAYAPKRSANRALSWEGQRSSDNI